MIIFFILGYNSPFKEFVNRKITKRGLNKKNLFQQKFVLMEMPILFAFLEENIFIFWTLNDLYLN
jgi:hypothetical protein